MLLSQQDIRELLLNDFNLRAETSDKPIIKDLHGLTIEGNLKDIGKLKYQCSFNKLLALGLQCAIMSGSEAIVSYFLNKGADPNRATSTLINFKRATWPIFHRHSKYSDNHYESDDCSDDESNNEAGDEYSNIDRDIDDCCTKYGDDDQIEGYIPSLNGKTTALHLAALIGKPYTIKKLLHKARDDFGSQVSQTESSPLIIAAWLGNTGVVKALLPYERQFSFYGFLHTPLQAASARAHHDIVRFILQERDVNIASGGYPTPLCAASRHGQINVATLLIKHGAELNPKSARVLDTPLSNAIMNSQFEAIRFLLRKGAMFNPALLLEEYCRIDEEALDIVLQHAMKKKEAEWCYNALCIQCSFGDYDYVFNLLSKRKEMFKLQQMDQNGYDNLGGNGPLVIAMKYRHKSLVELLLKTKTPSIFRGNIVLAAVESGDNDIILSVLADPKKTHLLCDKCDNGVAAFIAAVRSEKYSAACVIWEYIREVADQGIDALYDEDELKELVQYQLKRTKAAHDKAKNEYVGCLKLNETLGLSHGVEGEGSEADSD